MEFMRMFDSAEFIPYLTEAQAAEFLAVAPDTLRVWRTKSRAAGHLIGPRWIERGGEGRARLIRYRRQDLEAFLEAGAVKLEPKKRLGRPRKAG
ncbi:MAG TPA: helix-turn-helix domain-containing protein [Magnetospirillum sp.]|nr:helix-turn-helix domain-containing protein [Magnetospirillum sp.]